MPKEEKLAVLTEDVIKEFTPEQIEALTVTTSTTLKDMNINEAELSTPALKVAVALTRGIVENDLTKAAPVLIALAQLIDSKTFLGVRKQIEEAAGVKFPVFTNETGTSIKALDGLQDPEALLSALQFNYLVAPNILQLVTVLDAASEYDAAVRNVLERFGEWVHAKDPSKKIGDVVDIELLNEKTLEAVKSVINQKKGRVVSGTDEALSHFEELIGEEFMTTMALAEEDSMIQDGASQAIVMSFLSGAAGSLSGETVVTADELQHALLDQVPGTDGFKKQTNGRVAITSKAISSADNINALFAAFQAIQVAA